MVAVENNVVLATLGSNYLFCVFLIIPFEFVPFYCMFTFYFVFSLIVLLRVFSLPMYRVVYFLFVYSLPTNAIGRNNNCI